MANGVRAGRSVRGPLGTRGASSATGLRHARTRHRACLPRGSGPSATAEAFCEGVGGWKRAGVPAGVGADVAVLSAAGSGFPGSGFLVANRSLARGPVSIKEAGVQE